MNLVGAPGKSDTRKRPSGTYLRQRQLARATRSVRERPLAKEKLASRIMDGVLRPERREVALKAKGWGMRLLSGSGDGEEASA